jgi:hypothetical protein
MTTTSATATATSDTTIGDRIVNAVLRFYAAPTADDVALARSLWERATAMAGEATLCGKANAAEMWLMADTLYVEYVAMAQASRS